MNGSYFGIGYDFVSSIPLFFYAYWSYSFSLKLYYYCKIYFYDYTFFYYFFLGSFLPSSTTGSFFFKSLAFKSLYFGGILAPGNLIYNIFYSITCIYPYNVDIFNGYFRIFFISYYYKGTGVPFILLSTSKTT